MRWTRLPLLGCLALAWAQGVGLASRSKGRPDAPITVYEMSDFQCPYCRQFALETMPVLEREYVATGKIRFIYINLPLTNLHKHAVAAAVVAICAAEQGRFWPVHDRLFERQPQWAAQADPGRYLTALADSAGAEADSQAAARAGAYSTPTFYIEGGLIDGAAPAAVFRAVLDSIYRSKAARPAAPAPSPR